MGNSTENVTNLVWMAEVTGIFSVHKHEAVQCVVERRPFLGVTFCSVTDWLNYLYGHYNLLIVLATSSNLLQTDSFRANVLQSPLHPIILGLNYIFPIRFWSTWIANPCGLVFNSFSGTRSSSILLRILRQSTFTPPQIDRRILCSNTKSVCSSNCAIKLQIHNIHTIHNRKSFSRL